MTEFELYRIEEDLYYFIQSKFSQENIPPFLKRMIIESIYNKILNESNSYIYSIQVKEKLAEQEEKYKQEQQDQSFEMSPRDQSIENASKQVSNNKGALDETPEGVTYE